MHSGGVVQPHRLSGTGDGYVKQATFFSQHLFVPRQIQRQLPVCQTDHKDMIPFAAFGSMNS